MVSLKELIDRGEYELAAHRVLYGALRVYLEMYRPRAEQVKGHVLHEQRHFGSAAIRKCEDE